MGRRTKWDTYALRAASRAKLDIVGPGRDLESLVGTELCAYRPGRGVALGAHLRVRVLSLANGRSAWCLILDGKGRGEKVRVDAESFLGQHRCPL